MFHFYSYPFRVVLVLLLLGVHLPASAQAPTWQSARAVAVATGAASGDNALVTATAVDAAGDILLAGRFSNTVALGSTTLTSRGISDVFIAKFNPASNLFVWALRAGGTGNDYPTALTVSGNSVYVAGTFDGATAGFGPVTLINADPTAVRSDGFVAKLTDAGTTGSFVWAQRVGGTGFDYATALATSGSIVYVAGIFGSQTAGFGSITLTNADLVTSTGSYDTFVAKLTDAGATGSFVWAQRAGGAGNDYASALAATGNSVYVAGSFDSPTAGFGAVALSNAGSMDLYTAKLTDAGPTGSFAWAQRAGGVGNEGASALAVSGGSVYLTGGFNSPTVGFGATTLTNADPSAVRSDVFVTKLTDAGVTGLFTWAQRAGGSGGESVAALAVSGSSVYVAGVFIGATADFGAVTLTNASPGLSDVYVAKLTDAGTTGRLMWAQQAGGAGSDLATALTLRGSSVYVAGSFDGATAGFGATTLPNPNAPSNLGFLASLTDPTLTATTTGRALAAAQPFPNPAHHTATLRLPAGMAPAPLTLTDAQGRTVRRYPAPAGPEAPLDLQGMPAGVYLLHGAGRVQRITVQ